MSYVRTTVSQHLKELRDAGLIKGEINGSKINYCLCNNKIQLYIQMFDEFFRDIKTVDVNCDIN